MLLVMMMMMGKMVMKMTKIHIFVYKKMLTSLSFYFMVGIRVAHESILSRGDKNHLLPGVYKRAKPYLCDLRCILWKKKKTEP